MTMKILYSGTLDVTTGGPAMSTYLTFLSANLFFLINCIIFAHDLL